MNENLKQLFQTLIPLELRKKIYLATGNDESNKLRKKIIRYYSELPASKVEGEQKQVVNFLKSNHLSIFPYAFQEKYRTENVEIHEDSKTGLRYVFLDGKRLYFKRSCTEKQIRQMYVFLQMEQDPESPHRYLTNDFDVSSGDVVADIGAAEGNFSLTNVEKASKLYLFETDSEWIEAMELTFAPWREKVEIVNKFVSDRNNEKNITLDEFFKTRRQPDFVKIDVDGAESELVKGADQILSDDRPLKVAICTYHKQDDEGIFSELLKNKKFSVSHSDGYMIFYLDQELKAPYLRRGLIRAKR